MNEARPNCSNRSSRFCCRRCDARKCSAICSNGARPPGQYFADALRTVPLIIVSRILRTANPQIVLVQAFVLYKSFSIAAWFNDRIATPGTVGPATARDSGRNDADRTAAVRCLCTRGPNIHAVPGRRSCTRPRFGACFARRVASRRRRSGGSALDSTLRMRDQSDFVVCREAAVSATVEPAARLNLDKTNCDCRNCLDCRPWPGPAVVE